eukprot:CAMPEP_0206421380 /NCGR_PEP_ID=MMETSP0324_2-20121206/1407_1 /ASSEMBLY_ACC=CAM_ASM_000836 /TAXON_ID=2866 /ORGANISM="Crypthecodinium cohnii, Strain Seligo" /LENGTH=180 /DNA_ID=CAMNT_0053885451 /DNA_START=98 /DNA_END=641 /DNA_ORIENTATION=-
MNFSLDDLRQSNGEPSQNVAWECYVAWALVVDISSACVSVPSFSSGMTALHGLAFSPGNMSYGLPKRLEEKAKKGGKNVGKSSSPATATTGDGMEVDGSQEHDVKGTPSRRQLLDRLVVLDDSKLTMSHSEQLRMLCALSFTTLLVRDLPELAIAIRQATKKYVEQCSATSAAECGEPPA